MAVAATHRNARISARKVRLYRGVVKGKLVEEALMQLKFLPGKASQILYKVMASAAANAKNNHNLERKNLVVADVAADAGFTMRRFRPVSRGRAHQFRKKTAHVTVTLEEKK